MAPRTSAKKAVAPATAVAATAVATAPTSSAALAAAAPAQPPSPESPLDDSPELYAQNYLFYAHTNDEACIFKNLVEVLQNNLIDVCFNLTKDSIELVSIDDDSVLMNLVLKRENFDNWYCAKAMNIGINLQQLYKMIKSIKKKDSLTLYITLDRPNKLSIKRIASTGANRKPDISHINIQGLQSIVTGFPSGYGKPHVVSTTDFQKAVKEMAALSKTIDIQSNERQLTLRFEIEGLYGKVAELDQDPSKDGRECDLESSVYNFEKTYRSRVLSQFIKLPGLNATMRVYAEPRKLLKIEIDVGKLGVLTIYIKS